MTTTARLLTRPYRANTRATGRTIPLDLLIVAAVLLAFLVAACIGGAIHAAGIDAQALTGLGR